MITGQDNSNCEDI